MFIFFSLAFLSTDKMYIDHENKAQHPSCPSYIRYAFKQQRWIKLTVIVHQKNNSSKVTLHAHMYLPLKVIAPEPLWRKQPIFFPL